MMKALVAALLIGGIVSASGQELEKDESRRREVRSGARAVKQAVSRAEHPRDGRRDHASARASRRPGRETAGNSKATLFAT